MFPIKRLLTLCLALSLFFALIPAAFAYNVVNLPETMPFSEAIGVFNASSIERATLTNIDDNKTVELSSEQIYDFYYAASSMKLQRTLNPTPIRGTAINLYVGDDIYSYYVSSGLQLGKYGEDNYVCYMASGEDEVYLTYLDTLYEESENKTDGAQVNINTKNDFLKLPQAPWSQSFIKEAAKNNFLPYPFIHDYEKNITREEFCILLANYIAVSNNYKSMEDYMQDRNLAYLKNYFSDCENVNNAVNMLYALGIVNGKTETTFDPYGAITREEASKLLCTTAELSVYISTNAQLNYTDKNKISPWATYFVTWATDKKIMTGLEDNSFNPLGNYTVEQAVATINRLNTFVLQS